MSQHNHLTDWLTHFETLHPVGIDMGLSRVSQVWQNLCDIYHIDQLAKQKIITVAGTNGKGSACQMLTLLLLSQGRRIGTYTSPHIHHFRERVKINDISVDDKMLVDAFAAIETARGDISISYFEATTLVGLLCFVWQNVDFAVLEVGLGGRLDAVNIIDADAVLITSIGLDHEAFLGNDLSQIALEKAGVCRPNAPCVYAESGIYDSVIDFARDHNVPLIANGRDYRLDGKTLSFNANARQLRVPAHIAALGAHQVANSAGVLVLLDTLDLLPDDYASRLLAFSLAGRLQKIATSPDIVLDVAHNPAAARALADYLREQSAHYDNIYAVIGMLKDKDHGAVLQAFDDVFSHVFCGRTKGERGFSDSELTTIGQTVLACPVSACGDLHSALADAQAVAGVDDLIIAFGSFWVAEELIMS